MAISLLHTTSGTFTGTSSAITVPSTTGGSCLVVCAAASGSPSTFFVTSLLLAGVADNFALVTRNPVSAGRMTEIWADPNCAAGKTSVTISVNSSTTVSYVIYEFAGLLVSPVDQSNANGTFSTSTYSSGSTATTTQAAEVWVGAGYGSNGGIAGPSAYTNTAVGSNFVAGYQIVSATGSALYSGGCNFGRTGAAVATFMGGATTQQGAATLSGTGSLTTVSAQRAGATLGAAGSLTATPFVFTPPPVFPGRPPNPLGAKIELNLGGSWVDVTSFVMLRDLVTISNMGRADESGTITASQLTLTLKNDGRFTPKNSAGAYFPNIVRNCQIRVSVNAQSKTGVIYAGYRFYGEIASWPPGYDISQRDTYVRVTASGIWRRISANQVPIGSSYARYVNLLTGSNAPRSYWSMEDGPGTGTFANALETGTPNASAGTTGQPSFAADSASFAGSDALPTLNGARITCTVAAGGSPTFHVVRFVLSVPAGGDSFIGTGMIGQVAKITSPGTVATVIIQLLGNQLTATGFSSGGAQLFTGTIPTKVNGVPVLVSYEQTAGAWALKIIKPGGGPVLDQVSNSGFSWTLSTVTAVFVSPQGRLTDTTFGHLSVGYSGTPLITDAAYALGGRAGESAVDRFTRLCGEFAIPASVTGSASAAMGPQADDTLANILQSIEDTDGGILYETRDQFGLGYRTLASMKDQAATVTVAYTAGALGAPLTPVYDDQLAVNSWTVTNYDGYASLGQLTSGAMSVLAPPNGIGQGYARSKTVNANAHAQVDALAQQLLFQGTTDEVRYPVVAFNFLRTAAASFFSSVPSLRLGDYLQVTSLPSFLGGGTAKQLIWGYTETIGGNPEGWTIEFNTIPEAPFESSFSPGVFSVAQAVNGSVAAGSAVGSTVSASQLGPGAALPGTISARSIGGITQFISAATPYDWVFAVTGTPADATYFTCTEEQSAGIAAGDTFSNSGGLGGPFTVTSVDPPAGGLVSVHFTPDASSVMSSGTVTGGKNGDQWVNTSGGNQVNIWTAGAWVPVSWDASQVITAGTITASQIAAGIVIAGVVDGTLLQGVSVIADGTSGEILVYSGSPAPGNLIGSWSGAAGTDAPGNTFPAGLAVESGGLVLYSQGSAPAAVSGASTIYTSSLGRLRYLSSSGADLVLDRSALNLTNFSMTTQTIPHILSGTLSYLANEAVVGSEYEIEVDGTITTPSGTTATFTFDLFNDGAAFGAGSAITVGTVIIQTGFTYAFTLRARATVNTSGASGNVTVALDGSMTRKGVNVGNAQQFTTLNNILSSAAFDTTANHSFAIYCNWSSTAGTGHSAIVYRTKITRRN